MSREHERNIDRERVAGPDLRCEHDLLADDIAAERELDFNGHVCEHGRNLDRELCERCAADDAELDAL